MTAVDHVPALLPGPADLRTALDQGAADDPHALAAVALLDAGDWLADHWPAANLTYQPPVADQPAAAHVTDWAAVAQWAGYRARRDPSGRLALLRLAAAVAVRAPLDGQALADLDHHQLADAVAALAPVHPELARPAAAAVDPDRC